MKRVLIIVLTIMTIAVLSNCVKKLDIIGSTETLFKGRVIEKSQHEPISGVKVSVSDGSHVHASAVTGDDGRFEFRVAFDELTENYLLHLDCEGYASKTEKLFGMGQDEYDYKDIVFFDNSNPNNWPQVYTTNVTDITASSAKSGGYIFYSGAGITARGVCWNVNHDPTISNHHTIDGSGIGDFLSTMTDLDLNTIYYVRAYATNVHGTYYGTETSFKTLEGYPTVVLDKNSFFYISSTSFRCKSTINTDGGFPVTCRGVCWSTNPMPTIADNQTDDGVGIGDYNSTITGLNSSNTYYIRAYAINSMGIAYSEQFVLQSDHFVYYSLPRFEYEGDTYFLYPDPGMKMDYSAAESYCADLEYGGFYDWTLPRWEVFLYGAYPNMYDIGGFVKDEYWAKSENIANGGYIVDFRFGQASLGSYSSKQCRVRPVRKNN